MGHARQFVSAAQVVAAVGEAHLTRHHFGEANEAKTPIQMINAQEDINGLIDRMDKQEAIEESAHERLLELMDAVLGDKGFPVSKEQSYKSIELHEL